MRVKIELPTLPTSPETSPINDSEAITQEDIENCKKTIGRIRNKLITNEDEDNKVLFKYDSKAEFAKALESKLSEYNLLMWQSAPKYETNSKCVEICNLILDADLQIIQNHVDFIDSATIDIIIALMMSFLVIRSFAPFCEVHILSYLEKMLSFFRKWIDINWKSNFKLDHNSSLI